MIVFETYYGSRHGYEPEFVEHRSIFYEIVLCKNSILFEII